MSAPLDFLRLFAGQLRGARVRFAITSGMACVHYGLQQTTKDTDWIVAPEDLELLRDLVARLEGGMPPWRVSYRAVFGAPLERDYLVHGWTSHLSVWDRADSPEQKVDLFGRPPRVRPEECHAEAGDFAGRHVVAQMKKTDRDKDWFAVDGLGLQEWLRGQARGVLHIRSLAQLRQAWQSCPTAERAGYLARRPVLRQLEGEISDERLERLLHVERALWQGVNRERYGLYQREWKAFYRRWQSAAEWSWPVAEPFWTQHQRVVSAARQHGLPPDPLAGPARVLAYEQGVRRASTLTGASPAELELVQPPLEEMLP